MCARAGRPETGLVPTRFVDFALCVCVCGFIVGIGLYGWLIFTFCAVTVL